MCTMVHMIECRRCHTSKPETDYHRKGQSYQPMCKPCRREYGRDHPQVDRREAYRDPVAAAARRLALVDVRGEDECWPWLGTVQRGYGTTGGGRLRRKAHRAIYEDTVGPIPSGMTLDHECHNRDKSCRGGDSCPHRKCCNPRHLRPKSMGDNLRASHVVREVWDAGRRGRSG